MTLMTLEKYQAMKNIMKNMLDNRDKLIALLEESNERFKEDNAGLKYENAKLQTEVKRLKHRDHMKGPIDRHGLKVIPATLDLSGRERIIRD